MNNVETSRTLYDEDLRLDRITWLAGAIEGFTDDHFFDDAIVDAFDGEDHIHESMSIFREVPEWARDNDEVFLEWCANKGILGFVVEVSTPKPIQFHDNGHTSCGWGFTARTYLYVEQLDDAVPLAVSWRDQRMEKWRAEASVARTA